MNTVQTLSPVEGIFGVRSVLLYSKESHGVGFVLCPQQWRLLAIWTRTHVEMTDSKCFVVPSRVPLPHLLHEWLPRAALMFAAPDPRVPVPQSGQEVEPGCLRPTICHRDLYQNIIWTCLGVLGKDIPVSRLVKDSGILQLKLLLSDSSSPVLLHQLLVGEGSLGILVESLHVGVGGGGVQVVVALLGVFSVVPLGPRETKYSLLEDGVLLIPEGNGKAEATLAVADAQQPIFSPPVGSHASMFVREIIPAGEREGEK